MKAIYPYRLPMDGPRNSPFDLELPVGAQILRPLVRNGMPVLDVLADADAGKEKRTFFIHDMTLQKNVNALGKPHRYLGELALSHAVIYHVFEVVKPLEPDVQMYKCREEVPPWNVHEKSD